MNIYDVTGILGAALILFGLFRTTTGKWDDKSLLYELDHLLGSALLIIYLVHNRAYIGIVINVAYAWVSFFGFALLRGAS